MTESSCGIAAVAPLGSYRVLQGLWAVKTNEELPPGWIPSLKRWVQPEDTEQYPAEYNRIQVEASRTLNGRYYSELDKYLAKGSHGSRPKGRPPNPRRRKYHTLLTEGILNAGGEVYVPALAQDGSTIGLVLTREGEQQLTLRAQSPRDDSSGSSIVAEQLSLDETDVTLLVTEVENLFDGLKTQGGRPTTAKTRVRLAGAEAITAMLRATSKKLPRHLHVSQILTRLLDKLSADLAEFRGHRRQTRREEPRRRRGRDKQPQDAEAKLDGRAQYVRYRGPKQSPRKVLHTPGDSPPAREDDAQGWGRMSESVSIEYSRSLETW